MLKNILLYLLLFILGVLLGVIAEAYLPELKDFIKNNNGIALLSYTTQITAMIGVAYWLWQINQTRNKTEIDMALKMAEKFDSDSMIRHRIQASKALLASNSEPNPSVDAILNFFEEIDFLMEKSAISGEVAWNFFSYWVLRYCLATKTYRENAEKEDDDILGFAGIENIYNRLIKLEKKFVRKEGGVYQEISGDDIIEFLNDESILGGKPQRFRINRKIKQA